MPIEDDKKRFTEVYNRENDSLFRFCLLRVSSREKAIELTQEAFLRLWSSIFAGKSVENPRAFLYVTARHLIIDWYRRHKSLSLESLAGEDDRPFDVEDEPRFAEIEIHSDAKRVISMLNNLEPQYREVVYMRFVEDLPPKDIAQILKLNANTVSVRITRGMDALRKLINGEK